jgi:hypothetical protein
MNELERHAFRNLEKRVERLESERCSVWPRAREQRHTEGLVGKLWRIKDPATVQAGNCFMNGRLKENDLWLCVGHAGDCFQNYIFVEEYQNCLIGRPDIKMGSYGIGEAMKIALGPGEFEVLKGGGRVER